PVLTPQQALLLKQKIQPLPPATHPDYQTVVIDLLTRMLVESSAIKSPIPNRPTIFVGQKRVRNSGMPIAQCPNPKRLLARDKSDEVERRQRNSTRSRRVGRT